MENEVKNKKTIKRGRPLVIVFAYDGIGLLLVS